jgi:molecular chaperone HscB
MPPDASEAPDHFSLFGLPRRFAIDASALESAFLALSREFHPDRHAAAPAEERAGIQRSSARVNDAYRTLRDPTARAEYLLGLEGVERPAGEPRCPSDLLEEVFTLREELLESPGPEFAEKVRRMAARSEEWLAALTERHDAAASPEERREILEEIREALDRRKFIANLVREVEQTLGG